MSEEEMKKWHIDRVQISLENVIQRWEYRRTITRSDTDLVENALTTWRNAVLAAISFAASIILGFSSLDLFKEVILQMLVADIIVGLIAFIAFTIIKGKIHGLILLMDGAYLVVLDRLSLLKYNFIRQTYSVEKIEDQRIHFFFSYHDFASSALRVHLIYALEKMSSSIFFKKKFAKELDDEKQALNYALYSYQQSKSLWKQYPSDLQTLSFVHERFFGYFGYKIDEKTGEITND